MIIIMMVMLLMMIIARQKHVRIPDRCRSGFENEGPPVLRIRMNAFAPGGRDTRCSGACVALEMFREVWPCCGSLGAYVRNVPVAGGMFRYRPECSGRYVAGCSDGLGASLEPLQGHVVSTFLPTKDALQYVYLKWSTYCTRASSNCFRYT